MEKMGFSFEEHQKIGRELFVTQERLISALVKISSAYPLKVSSKLDRAIDIIYKVRSDLDDRLFKEHRGKVDTDLTRIYYPGKEQGAPGVRRE